jgi:hypothetical protein
MADDAHEQQMIVWQNLYNRVCDVLEQFGEEDSLKPGDYWVHDDYWGHPQVKIYINNLKLLEPNIIRSLQAILPEFPGWELVAAVCVRGEGEKWPDMGLTIRAGEIVDNLQRRYFPEEFRAFGYDDSPQDGA